MLRLRFSRTVISVSLFFAAVLTAVVVLLVLTDSTPVVHEVLPGEFREGDVLSIVGRNFGASRDQSYVSIAGRRITASGYLSWDDTEIRVRVPDFSASGLLVVHRTGDASEGLLVRHRDDIPQALEHVPRSRPTVATIDSGSLAVGDLLTIGGRNFGERRRGRDIVFAGAAGTPVHARHDEIESWNDRGVRVRVPDGAVSGPVTLETPTGNQRLGEITVITPGVTRRYGEAVPIPLELHARISSATGRLPAALWLWWPQPRVSQMQGEMRRITTHQPAYLPHTDDMILFEWRNAEGAVAGVRQTVIVPRSSVEFEFTTGQLRTQYSTSAAVYRQYTVSEALYGMSESRVTATARQVFVQNNPLTTARRAFDAAVRAIAFDASGSDDVSDALEASAGSSKAIARYMTGLLRLGLVPARVVHGVRVTEAGGLPTYSWVEFFLPGVGWVPADPAARAGADEYYFAPEQSLSGFGRLDARRVEFSAGRQTAVRLLPDSETLSHPAWLTQSGFHAEWSPDVVDLQVLLAPPTLLETPIAFRVTRAHPDPPGHAED